VKNSQRVKPVEENTVNTNRIDDPALKALEDQLAGLVPQLSAADQQDLLYQCAFTAGRQAMIRPLRRWQGAVAALAVLAVSLSVPLVNTRPIIAKHEPQSSPTKVELVAAIPTPEAIRPIIPAGQFDAWQVALSSSDAVASNLQQLERIDPETRPLAVAALTRAALQQ
jgi:hypothetical protein